MKLCTIYKIFDKLIRIFHFRNLPSLIFILLILKLISMAKSMLGKVSSVTFFILFFSETWQQFYSLRLHLTVTWSIVGVALLPFVDEKRLLSALEKVYPDLTDAEREYKKNLRSVILGNSKLNIVLLINLIVQMFVFWFQRKHIEFNLFSAFFQQ